MTVAVLGLNAPAATAVATGPVVAISTSTYGSCALSDTRALRCWGFQGVRTAGNTMTGSGAPTTMLSGVTQADGGLGHVCGLIAGGTVKCWGDNQNGQLGNNSRARSETPVAVQGLSGAKRITLGSAHSCALLNSDAIQCWGDNSRGQLGNGGFSASAAPFAIATRSPLDSAANVGSQTRAFAKPLVIPTSARIRWVRVQDARGTGRSGRRCHRACGSTARCRSLEG